jgi:lipoprotein-anchoring transpeptidase ErfK/SrfK
MVKPRILLISAVIAFGLIGVSAIMKKRSAPSPAILQTVAMPLPKEATPEAVLNEIDRVPQLFALDSSKLPIVETISYTSRVPWQKGRPAWVADYASYYATSRHFIARSLNQKPDYFTQKVSPGDRFNVFRKDKNIQFYLVADLSKCHMRFYYYDVDTNERVLLKTYRIGVGRADSKKSSGYLTPTGRYLLGSKTAVYSPGVMGFFQDKSTEMIRVFGTRWIPFEKEIDGCSESAKGFGIHGSPWFADPNGQLVEDRTKVSKYESDGCIRLLSEDIEELFSIIVTKPTQIDLVSDFSEAKLPGVEKSAS